MVINEETSLGEDLKWALEYADQLDPHTRIRREITRARKEHAEHCEKCAGDAGAADASGAPIDTGADEDDGDNAAKSPGDVGGSEALDEGDELDGA